MAVWREKREGITHSLPLGDYRSHVIVFTNHGEPVKLRFFRYTGEARTPILWRVTPDRCVEVLIEERVDYPNLAEGKEAARRILHSLVEVRLKTREVPYILPPGPEFVARIEHPTKMLEARIQRWPNRFEIRFLGYVPNGYALPAATPSVSTDFDFEWGQLDFLERLCTDSLEEAVAAANTEFEVLLERGEPVRDRV